MENQVVNKNVIFYRDNILPLSETFIYNQARLLKEYTPHFVGSHIISNGINIDDMNSILINNNNSVLDYFKEKAFKLTLHPPASLVRSLQKLKPHLIHAHFAFDAVYALTLADALDIPLLVSLLGYDVTQYDEVWESSPHFNCRMFPKRRDKMLKSKRVHFISISEDLKKVAVQRGYPEDKITVHHVGVDTERFIPSGVLGTELTVLFVGRLVEKKGCLYLLEAMQKVQKVLPDAKVFFIGDGPLRQSLETASQNLAVNAVFMGARDNNFVREQMNAARVICVPSITSTTGDTEGLPIVVWEAMALGKPIVASHSAGIPEAIIHRRTGMLSPEKDTESLAQNILQLLQSDSLCKTLAYSARKECEERFSLQNQTKKLEKLYSSLCKRD